MSKLTPKPSNENGFASLVVGLILVLVLGLLVVGFAQLVRHEQAQTLDKQLSTQAFYAAESGVNDAVSTLPGRTTSKTDCAPFLGINNVLNQAGNVEYTCVMIDLHPTQEVFSPVSDQSTAEQFASYLPADGSSPNVSTVTITWSCVSGAQCLAGGFPTMGNLPPSTSWPAVPSVLEVGLTPLNNVTRAAMTNTTYTAVLYPQQGGGTGAATDSPGGTQSGTPVRSGCTAGTNSYNCSATITVSARASSNYLLRLRSIYSPSAVNVSITGPGGSTLDFQNGQVIIDSTGKAQDVLKRIQVHLTPGVAGQYPNSLEANAICKTLDVSPILGITAPDAQFPGTDTACQLN